MSDSSAHEQIDRGPMLVLVATPIGNLADISERALVELGRADSVACEDTRRTGSLFARLGIEHTPFIMCNEHTERRAAEEIIARIGAGERVALVSDAGTPAVSDPGQKVVEAVLDAGFGVESIPGPSAALVALTVSGFATDRFCVEGFLPRKGAQRTQRLNDLRTEQRTSVIFEAPHRISKTVDDLQAAVGGDRRAAIARELTKRFEAVWRGTLSDAATHLVETEPRGEYVIVLEGAGEAPVTEEMLRAALQTELDSGCSRRDAVDAVVSATGAKKRQVYDLALQLDSSSRTSEAD